VDFDQIRSLAGEREAHYNAPFHKLMRMFAISVLVSFIGTAVGLAWLPPALVPPLVIVELGMLVAAFFIRRREKPIGYTFLFAFCFISGVTVFPAVQHYMGIGGSALIIQAFALTTAIFAGLSVYAYYSKRDFSFLRGFLTVGLLALIGLAIIGLFADVYGGPLGLAIAFAGIMIFSGFVLYDIAQYRHGVTDEMIPLAVLGLYLTFINLFLYVLRFIGILSDD